MNDKEEITKKGKLSFAHEVIRKAENDKRTDGQLGRAVLFNPRNRRFLEVKASPSRVRKTSYDRLLGAGWEQVGIYNHKCDPNEIVEDMEWIENESRKSTV